MLISSESDASCSFGSSEEELEVEEECIDMEDDSDEDEGVMHFFGWDRYLSLKFLNCLVSPSSFSETVFAFGYL